MSHASKPTQNFSKIEEPTAYERSIQKIVIEAEKYFWSKNELRPKDGAREPGCPPNTVRTNIPRLKTYNPSKKFTNGRRKKLPALSRRKGIHNSD
jgi:hypothetical protein